MSEKESDSPDFWGNGHEEIYRTLFEQAADGIFISDENGRYLDVNPRGCEMLGYTREEILSKTIRDLVSAHELKTSPLKLDQLRAGKVVISERNLICKDGSLLPVEISARMLSNGRLLGITRDIRERKRVEQLLVESEERYRNLFHHMAEGLAYCQMIFEDGQPVDWIYLEVNEAFPALTGLKDITGKRVTEAIPGIRETNPELFEIYGRVSQTRQPEQFEIFLETLEIWFSVSAFSPQQGYFVAVFDVITERKRAEKILRASEEKFRTIADFTNGWEYWIGVEGKHIYVSPACERITGYTPEDFVQDPKLLQKITHPDDKHLIDHHFSDTLEDTHTVGLDFRIIHKDGGERWINHVCMPVYDNDGRWVGRRASNRDVTERVQAEQALKENEARYRYLFENNPHPMWVYDLKTLAFLAVNDAAIAKYGYTREEFLSMTIKDIRPQEDLPRLLENLAQPRQPLEHSTGWRHRLKDGTIIDVEISSHTIDLEGHYSALVVAQDVTERKKAEARVRYLTRLYATLSQVNQTIVRVETRDELFQSICEVAVKFGEFHMAWIGLLNPETGAVKPAAQAGNGQDYLDSIVVHVEKSPYSQGPTGTALRSGAVEFSDDIANDKRMKPWRDEALKRGFRSAAAVPIRQGGQVIGTLNLYAQEPGFFSEEERSLLEEISLDISYAIARLEAEAERKRAEAALKESEEQYRNLYENATIGMYRTTPSGEILMCNPALVDMLGFASFEELARRNLEREGFESDDQRQKFREQIEAEGMVNGLEAVWYKKDGSRIYVRESAKAVKDDAGKVLYYEGTVEDITDRKLAENALRASEQRYRQLFENNQAGVYYTSLDGSIINCNEAFAKILGYDSITEIKTHRAAELYFDVSERDAYLKKLKKSGSLTDFELRLKRKDGSPVWILENVRIATDDTGNPLYTHGTLIDITERKKAEEALRASEKRYRQLFENNQAGIFFTSLDGRILDCNDRFAEIFGYKNSDEIKQHSAKEFYFNIETRNAYIEDLKKSGRLTNYELLLKRKDGSPVWILENVVIAADEDGQPSQIHGTLVDITERKRAEDALRESEHRYQSLAETMTALYETTRDLVSERDLIRLLHTIVERAARLLNATGGGLYLADPQNRKVRCMVSYNTPRNYTGIELNYGEGAAGLVAQTEQPLIINNYSQWAGRAKVYDNEKPFRAVLSVPMKWQDELIGVIHILDYTGERKFTDADKDLMLLFANQAAIAAKNASLYTLAQEELLEHKRTEEALRASEQKFQTVANFTADWEYWVNPEGKHIWVSPSCELLTGYSADEFMDDPDLFPRIIHPEDRETFSAHINRENHTVPEQLDLRIIRRDGGLRWINHICHHVYSQDGTWMGLRASNRDITERKQAEQLQEAVYQIAQTAQTTQSLEELVPQIHKVISNIMPAENFYIALYDEENNQLNYPYSVDEIDPPTAGYVPLRKGLTEYVLRTGKSLLCPQSVHKELEQAGEVELVGAPAPIWLGVPLKIDAKTIGVMAVQHYTDPLAYGEREQRILEFVSSQVAIALSRKQAETALRESQARFATVFRSSPMAIAITRLKDSQFVDVNASWLNLTGFSRDETLGHTPQDLGVWVQPEERSRLVSILNKKGTVGEFEFQMRKKSGEISDMLISAELIELSGEACILSMALDISERKKAEEKIRQQVNRLTALNTIDRVIASSFDLGMTLNMLVSNISQQLNVSAASVMLYNSNSLMLDYAASHGFQGNEITRLSIHLGELHAGKVAMERRMVHVPDMTRADPPFNRYMTEAEGFVTYYGLPLIAKGEIKGVLEVYHRQPFEPDSDWLAFLETMAEQAAIAIDSMQLFEGMQRSNLELSLAYDATIEGWSYALDLRDKETEGHTQRVTEKTVELARAFGLGNHELVHIRRGALLHDIGKMGVPDSILLKPSTLTDEEWVVMKMHPTFARQMLERIQYLKPALDIPYCHHEKWDGSGYPRGLPGRQIPLAARIFAVVDVWDALMSDRPYRPAWPRNEVLRHIRAGSGSHFDPEVVEMFLNLEPNWNKPAG